MKLIRVSWCKEPVNVPGISFANYESEVAFQIFCADWLRKQFELTKNDGFRWWHHSANERQGAKAGFIAKMMGQGKGFPDFVHCGLKLALELKIPGRFPSREQVQWIKHFREIGWKSETVYTFEMFREIVMNRVRRRAEAR